MTDYQRQKMQQIEKKSDKVDEALDQLSVGIQMLGNMAGEMTHQLDVQNEIMADIEGQIDKAKDELNVATTKLEEIANDPHESTISCCMYIMCLVVLLGLLGVIFNMVFKSGGTQTVVVAAR